MSEASVYKLLGTDGIYESATKGTLGGNRESRIYGRLDCPAATRAFDQGYKKIRVFFADEASAIAARYRPCGTCMRERYQQHEAKAPLPPGPLGIGPQHPGDAPFTARMRFHQSWYRAERLREPYGTGPTALSESPLGNMLIDHAAAAGRNFLTPAIHAVAKARIKAGGGVEEFRCLRNMLSSQPMCINLFAPLVENHELATRLVGALLPDEVARVTDVRIEFAPTPKRDYLDDSTSFDVFVEYERIEGGLGFLGIETKLTEPFSTDTSADPAKYIAHARRSPTLWPEGAYAALPDRRWYQLWRNHLLVEALRMRTPGKYAAASCVVVHHPADAACSSAIAGYRDLLANGADSLLDWPLDRLIATWVQVASGTSEWLAACEARYLDLSLSEDAWKRLRSA
jgi:hypothetical protein